MKFKLGRLPRRYSPAIPHMSALTAGQTLEPPPVSADWTKALGDRSLGMMLNDQLGDCTCAALGHARQVWSANVGPQMLTPPDHDILLIYEGACGYRPKDPSTDQGGDEQTVLTYAVKQGIPTMRGRDHLTAFVEIDPRNLQDVKRAIASCGLVYIGFNVPAYLENFEDPGAVWDVDPSGDNSIVGGHAVILPGYNEASADVVSWGALYTMTWAFWAKFVDECYALADADWIAATGMSPAGLTLAQLEAQMAALKEAST